MRSLLWLWLVALLFQYSVAQAQKPKLYQSKGEYTAPAQQVPDNPRESPPSNTQSARSTNLNGRQESGNDTNQKPTDDRIVWFTGVLALVGVLQFGTMVMQYCAMRKQGSYMLDGLRVSLRSARAAKIAATASLRGMVLAKKSYDLTKDSMDIARVSAKAASVSALASDKSAESLINSERAWIMAELVFSADLPAPAPTKSRIVYGDSSDGRHTIAIDVCLICRNDGRTPAWISCTRIHFRNLLDIPDNPDFSPLPTDYLNPTLQPVHVGGEVKTRWSLECDGPTDPKKVLVVYGVVKYRDVFRPERETRFAYTVRGAQLIRLTDDYWEYSKFT